MATRKRRSPEQVVRKLIGGLRIASAYRRVEPGRAGDRALNDTIARSPIGPMDIAAECGQSGGVLADMVQRTQAAGGRCRT
jgi:hypothetical protein